MASCTTAATEDTTRMADGEQRNSPSGQLSGQRAVHWSIQGPLQQPMESPTTDQTRPQWQQPPIARNTSERNVNAPRLTTMEPSQRPAKHGLVRPALLSGFPTPSRNLPTASPRMHALRTRKALPSMNTSCNRSAACQTSSADRTQSTASVTHARWEPTEQRQDCLATIVW